MGQVRGFFEQELRGLYSFDQVMHHPSIARERPRKGSADFENERDRWLLGKFREIVTITFGDYELTVESPEEKPALGWIKLVRADGVVSEGPLDQATWADIARFIRGKSDGER